MSFSSVGLTHWTPRVIVCPKRNLHRLHWEGILTASRTAALPTLWRVAFHQDPSVRSGWSSSEPVLASSLVPQERTALLSHSTGRAKEPFFQLVHISHTSALWGSQTVCSLQTDLSSHWFYFAPKGLGNSILQNTSLCFCRMMAHLHNQP